MGYNTIRYLLLQKIQMLQYISEFILVHNQALLMGNLKPYGYELGPILRDRSGNLLATIYRVAGQLYLAGNFLMITYSNNEGENAKVVYESGFRAMASIKSDLPMGEILQHYIGNLGVLGEGRVAEVVDNHLVAKTNRAGQFFQDVFYKIGV